MHSPWGPTMFKPTKVPLVPTSEEKLDIIAKNLIFFWSKFPISRASSSKIPNLLAKLHIKLVKSYQNIPRTAYKSWNTLTSWQVDKFSEINNLKHLLQSFNINTNDWVARYIFKVDIRKMF